MDIHFNYIYMKKYKTSAGEEKQIERKTQHQLRAAATPG